MNLRVLRLAFLLAVFHSAASGWSQQTVDDRLYTNPVYKWSVSYPMNWALDSQDPTFVKIRPPAGLPFGLVGIQSAGTLRPEFRRLDDFVDVGLSAEAAKPGFQILSRTRTALPDGTAAVEVINVLGVGTVGKSRKLCTVVGEQGFCLNAETYLNSWAALEPYFDRIIRSFTIERPYVQLWQESGTLLAQGRRAEAKAVAERALKLSEEMQGREHPDVALSLHNLGEVYRMDALFSRDEATRQHAAAVAESMHKRAFAIREKTIGLTNSLTISTMISLADDYRLQRRYDEAEPLYKRALEVLEGIGPRAPILQTLEQRARIGLTELEKVPTK